MAKGCFLQAPVQLLIGILGQQTRSPKRVPPGRGRVTVEQNCTRKQSCCKSRVISISHTQFCVLPPFTDRECVAAFFMFSRIGPIGVNSWHGSIGPGVQVLLLSKTHPKSCFGSRQLKLGIIKSTLCRAAKPAQLMK